VLRDDDDDDDDEEEDEVGALPSSLSAFGSRRRFVPA
jgi:hypothetical protein